MVCGYADQEEMALKKEIAEEIRGAVRAAFDEHARARMTRFKSWSPLGAVVAVGIFALVQWNGYTEFKTHTNDRLDVIEKSQRLSTAAAAPAKPSNQAEVKTIIDEARRDKKKLPLATVQQAGDKFIEASQSAGAWSTALELLDYRSVLNEGASSQLASEIGKFNGHYDYNGMDVPGKPKPTGVMSDLGLPANDMALMEYIGKPSNPNATGGPAFLKLTGGAIRLDGMRMRHVLIESTQVYYSGGPVQLDDVVFINCMFVFDNNEGSVKLAEAVLSKERVSITT